MSENQKSIGLLKSSFPDIIELKSEVLEILDQSIQYHVVSNTDSLLDHLISKGAAHEDVIDERIPYWADLWPSAIALAQFIFTDEGINKEVSVLELGCGLAIPGIAAGIKGAEVCLTDYLPDALRIAELNWRTNIHDRIPDCRLMDWRNPDIDFKPDIIIASDIAYEERAFQPLISTFRTLVSSNGRILLSEPGRPIAKPFLKALKEEGYHICETVFDVKFQTRQLKPVVYELIFQN